MILGNYIHFFLGQLFEIGMLAVSVESVILRLCQPWSEIRDLERAHGSVAKYLSQVKYSMCEVA